MTKYNKADIGRAAAQYGFVRDTFEKVLRLKEILKYFNTQEYLATHLILKGGTAINLTVFNLQDYLLTLIWIIRQMTVEIICWLPENRLQG